LYGTGTGPELGTIELWDGTGTELGTGIILKRINVYMNSKIHALFISRG